MNLKTEHKLMQLLRGINTKELFLIKKDFGLTETEIIYLLALSIRYRKNSKSILKKLILR